VSRPLFAGEKQARIHREGERAYVHPRRGPTRPGSNGRYDDADLHHNNENKLGWGVVLPMPRMLEAYRVGGRALKKSDKITFWKIWASLTPNEPAPRSRTDSTSSSETGQTANPMAEAQIAGNDYIGAIASSKPYSAAKNFTEKVQFALDPRK
jgi:hypothetical protein